MVKVSLAPSAMLVAAEDSDRVFSLARMVKLWVLVAAGTTHPAGGPERVRR